MTVVYVDSVFVLNAAADYLLLASTASLAGIPLRRVRYVLAGLLGGGYAVAVFLPGMGFLQAADCIWRRGKTAAPNAAVGSGFLRVCRLCVGIGTAAGRHSGGPRDFLHRCGHKRAGSRFWRGISGFACGFSCVRPPWSAGRISAGPLLRTGQDRYPDSTVGQRQYPAGPGIRAGCFGIGSRTTGRFTPKDTLPDGHSREFASSGG